MLLPHVSHAVLDADVTLARRRPRVTGRAGLRSILSACQRGRQQLGGAEVQPVDLQRVEAVLYVNNDFTKDTKPVRKSHDLPRTYTMLQMTSDFGLAHKQYLHMMQSPIIGDHSLKGQFTPE